jgi:centromere protein C
MFLRRAQIAKSCRKTGITLADRGVYDEHGLEPISGIFSSPEKSPPKRGDTVTASESMDIQESMELTEPESICTRQADPYATTGSIPDLTTANQILRNSRTYLPPPRSRSPKKTALGSSPRRQSSMAPRGSSIGVSSPIRAASHPAVARRLDFDQDESSLQETPALSGSGQRREQRANVYDIPEDGSPVPQTSAVLEESFVQEEITANEDSMVFNGVAEKGSIAQIGDDTTNGAEAVEELMELEESDMTPEPVKEPTRRGRKRKSDVLEPVGEESSSATKSRKRGMVSAQASESQKKGKEAAPVSAASSRRSKRVSDMTEQTDQDISALDGAHDAPAPAKKRGRPARAKDIPVPKPTKAAASKSEGKDNSITAKTTKGVTAQPKATETFKKPQKPGPKPKPKDKPSAKSKERTRATEQAPETNETDSGKLVDVHGHPLNKKDIEQMSTASAGSRYGRGRHLSVFRELEPDAVARVGRTGRHRVAPIDFWKNDRIAYDPTGSMTSIVKNQDVEPERKPYKASGTKGRKRNFTAIEEEEVELDPWEEDEGILVGNYRDFDPATDATTSDIIEDSKLCCVRSHFEQYLTALQRLHGLRKAYSQLMSQMAHSSTRSCLLRETSSTGVLLSFGQTR